MSKLLFSVFALAILSCSTGVLAWHQPDRYRAPYYSGQYYHDNSDFYRSERPYSYRQGVNQRPGIRIEKASDADGYLLSIYTRGMSPEDITISTKHGRIRLETKTLAWRDRQQSARSSTYGSFSRTLPLPPDADTSRLETRETDGMFEIWIPRK